MCKRISQYLSHIKGTSNLLKHKCNVQRNTITSVAKCEPETSISVTKDNEDTLVQNSISLITKDNKDTLVQNSISLITKDILPFELLDGEGMKDFAQCLIDAGATYGKANVNDLLPHSTTISKHVKSMADRMRCELKSELELVFSSIGGAIAVNMWTDHQRKINYLQISVHYIRHFYLYDRVLCVTEVKSNPYETTEYVKTSASEEIPEKRQKISLSDLEDSQDEADDDDDEVKKYLSLRVEKSEHFDLLSWWKEQSSELPYLTKIATFIHAIPATSTPIEQNSSPVNSNLRTRRAGLAPDTVNDILFLHSNMNKYW
ncbi:hypothetical protein Trydic_g2160 [Trypoxylus dichotomus]